MSCLVNPTGWRLYFSKYWNFNFFIDKKSYLLAFFKSRLLFEIALSIINKYYLKKWKKNILKFATPKLFLHFDTIYVLIGYKFYWKNILSNLEYISFKKAWIRKERLRFKKKKNLLFSSTIKNLLSVITKKKKNKKIKSIIFLNWRLRVSKYRSMIKKMIYYFFLMPQLIFLKDFLSNSMEKIVPYSNKKIFFFGLNQKNFNIVDVLDLVEFFLRNRAKTFFVLYRIIKILKFYKKKHKLSGFKFLLAGRFSRRDRATFVWKTFGSVGLASRISNINYYTRSMVLPYSKCIAKIWVCQN